MEATYLVAKGDQVQRGDWVSFINPEEIQAEEPKEKLKKRARDKI